MDIVNLKCKAKEWHLARIYSNLDKYGDGEEHIKKEYRNIYKRPLYFLLGVFSSIILFSLLSGWFPFISQMRTLLIMLIVVGAIYGFIWLVRDYKKYQEETKDITSHPDDDVTLYTLTSDGLYINYYNHPNHNYLIHWNDMKHVHVVTTELEPIYENDMLQTEAMKNLLKTEFSKAKQRVADFDYGEKIKQDGIFSLRIETKQEEIVFLPIPPSWEDQGVSDSFIEFVQKEVTGSPRERIENIRELVDKLTK